MEKDPVTWDAVPDGDSGVVTYEFGSLLTCSFTGTVPLGETEYSLIYYPDPWPGSGGCVFGTGTSEVDGDLTITGSQQTVPADPDNNMPAGIKIWVVPSSDYDVDHMTAWNPGNYLFEEHLLAIP